MGERKTYWLTKRVVNLGIVTVEAEAEESHGRSYTVGDRGVPYYRIGLYAFDNEADAKRNAAKAVKARIQELDQEKARLEAYLKDLDTIPSKPLPI